MRYRHDSSEHPVVASGRLAGAAENRSWRDFGDQLQPWSHLAMVGLFVFAVILALSLGSTFLIPVLSAVTIGLVFGPSVAWLERRGINSYLASVFIILAVCAFGFALSYALVGPLNQWAERAPVMWEKFTDALRGLRGPIDSLNEVSESLNDVASPDEEPSRIIKVTEDGLVPQLLVIAPIFIGQIVVFLCTLFFYLANRARLQRALLSFCLQTGIRLRVARTLKDIEHFLSRYMATITLINIGLGVSTTAILAMLGLPSPALWGAFAALLNFIPYAGPAVVAATLAGVGLLTFDGYVAVMLPVAAVIGLNVVESQLVTPGLLARALTMNPFAIFLSVVFWMWLWGPIGGLIAVPVLIVLQVAWRNLVLSGPARHAEGRRNVADPGTKSPAVR